MGGFVTLRTSPLRLLWEVTSSFALFAAESIIVVLNFAVSSLGAESIVVVLIVTVSSLGLFFTALFITLRAENEAADLHELADVEITGRLAKAFVGAHRKE